jgi:hypothetical protein
MWIKSLWQRTDWTGANLNIENRASQQLTALVKAANRILFARL